jgi:cytochrome P450
MLGSMLGAVLNEQLRIMPPTILIPKSVHPLHDQDLTLEGKKIVLPKGAFININVVGVQRNPKYWPSHGPSKVSGCKNDLDDFYPERWLAKVNEIADDDPEPEEENFGGFTGKDTAAQLFRPARGAFVPFSDGPRSCLGRRMAQVEVVAILAVIFQTYSVELAVDEWATDEEVDKMTVKERRVLYQKAQARSRATIRTATMRLTLKLHDGPTHIPLRFVRRGRERFVNVIT